MKERTPIYKKNRTTYFYWKIKNGKKTGRLRKTNDLNKVEALATQDILYFTIQYVWYYREIFVDVHFPDSCNSIVLCVWEGEISSLYRGNQKDLDQAVEDMLPTPVMKFLIKELLRMQSGMNSQPVSPRLLHNPKTVYNSDLLYECIEAPFKD